MRQRSFLTQFMQDHLDTLDNSWDDPNSATKMCSSTMALTTPSAAIATASTWSRARACIPRADLARGELTSAAGKVRIASPGPVVYAPDFAARQRPFLRVSFGVEARLAAAAERLRQACSETFAS